MTPLRPSRSLAVSETGFVFLPTTGETFTLNEIGRLVLNLMQSGRTHAEITTELAGHYDAPAAIIERDLEDFISQLRQYRLLEGEA